MAHARWRLVSVILILCAVAMAAQGAEGTKQAALNAAADGRLAQPVTAAVRGEPLREALRVLGEPGRVRLEAGRDVAELKVTLLPRDVTLGRALAEVAQLLDLTWTRRGTAPHYRYECARSQAATLRARAALEQARVTNRASVEAQLTRIAEAFRSGNPDTLAATDPAVGALLNDPNRGQVYRTMLSALAQMPPQGLQALVRAGQLTTSFDQMPPQAREFIRRETEGTLPMALGSLRGPDGNSVGYDTFLKSASYTLGVGGLDYGGNTYFGEIRAGRISMRFGIDLGIPGPPPPAPGAPAAAGAAGAGGGSAPQPRRPLPPRPEGTRATIEGSKPMSVREIADWLAEKTPLAVVSDYYATRYERPMVPVPPKASAEAALAALERYAAVEATVAPDDHVIRLRSRTWPLDDLMEPPPAAVEALRRALKANGRLGLAEYQLAAQLTDAQNAGLARVDEAKLGPIGRVLDGSRPWLKSALQIMASLTPAQRAAAESPAGLPAAQLLPGQHDIFLGALSRLRTELRPEEIAGSVFRIRRPDRPPMGPGGPGLPGAGGNDAAESYIFVAEPPGRPPMMVSLNLPPPAPRP